MKFKYKETIKRLKDEIAELDKHKDRITEYEFHINKDGSGNSSYKLNRTED